MCLLIGFAAAIAVCLLFHTTYEAFYLNVSGDAGDACIFSGLCARGQKCACATFITAICYAVQAIAARRTLVYTLIVVLSLSTAVAAFPP